MTIKIPGKKADRPTFIRIPKKLAAAQSLYLIQYQEKLDATRKHREMLMSQNRASYNNIFLCHLCKFSINSRDKMIEHFAVRHPQ
jgi:hypothetical protein